MRWVRFTFCHYVVVRLGGYSIAIALSAAAVGLGEWFRGGFRLQFGIFKFTLMWTRRLRSIRGITVPQDGCSFGGNKV